MFLLLFLHPIFTFFPLATFLPKHSFDSFNSSELVEFFLCVFCILSFSDCPCPFVNVEMLI